MTEIPQDEKNENFSIKSREVTPETQQRSDERKQAFAAIVKQVSEALQSRGILSFQATVVGSTGRGAATETSDIDVTLSRIQVEPGTDVRVATNAIRTALQDAWRDQHPEISLDLLGATEAVQPLLQMRSLLKSLKRT